MSQTETDPDQFDLNAAIVSTEDLDDDSPPPKPARAASADESDDVPQMTDPEWNEYVMRHFQPNELDPQGSPLVHGLRRVARLLLGPIVRSEAHVVQAPRIPPGGGEFCTLFEPAVVQYTVEVLMSRDTETAYPVVVSDAADVHHGNTDPDYLRFGTAMAATRAEARCLRKLLQLRGIASEERTSVSVPEPSLNGLINDTQVNFLNAVGRRNDIDMMKYINSGSSGKKYRSVWEVDAQNAAAMVKTLAGWETAQKVPEKVARGYKADWMK